MSTNLLNTYVPTPTSAGDPRTQTNNFAVVTGQSIPMDNYSGRVDHNFSDANQLFARYSIATTETSSDYVIDVGGKNINNRVQTSIALGDTIILSPRTLLTLSGGYTRWTQEGIQPSADMGALGFPASLVSLVQQEKVPNITNSDMAFFGAIEGSWFEHTNTWAYQANMRHTLSPPRSQVGFPERHQAEQLARRQSAHGTVRLRPRLHAGSKPHPHAAAPSDTASPATCWERPLPAISA